MSTDTTSGHGPGHSHDHGDGQEHDQGHGDDHGQGHGGGHGGGHGHGHGHGRDGTDIDWEAMADDLEANGELHLPSLRSTAARLKDLLGTAERIFDIGSGPGVMTCVFAEAFPTAEVVAVDPTPGLLDRALTRAARLGLSDRVTIRQAELPNLDGNLGTADLIWSSKAVHHLGDQQAALNELAGLLRPAGLLAVAEGGLPMRFLPRDIGLGRPGLQARLDAIQEQWFETMRTELPGSVATIEDWPAMLTHAGLTDVGSFTTLLDLPAPLSDPARAYLHAHLTRLRDAMSESLDQDDRNTLAALTDPDAPEGILHRPDPFLLTTTTVFTGRRTE
jgi:SAM-dependent methyltransferase